MNILILQYDYTVKPVSYNVDLYENEAFNLGPREIFRSISV